MFIMYDTTYTIEYLDNPDNLSFVLNTKRPLNINPSTIPRA
ncbi:hypothetical protein F7308_0857 [Francisella salina]|uniref:Uncharacterized protein n=1 Tax=Francisella salina TaxID=573569 RepID=A0ABM5M9A2_FRAST|nr:hypothetical protein F7308_0857 [Francisella salina]